MEEKGIKFYNIRTKEVKVARAEPMIAAYLNSSNRSPNALKGQDFGWRLSPETVVEMDRIRADQNTLNNIAAKNRVSPDEVTDAHVLKYIMHESTSDNTGVSKSDADFESDYHKEIEQLRQQQSGQSSEGSDIVENTSNNKKENEDGGESKQGNSKQGNSKQAVKS